MSETDEARSRRAIRECVDACALALDERDAERFAALFTEDGRMLVWDGGAISKALDSVSIDEKSWAAFPNTAARAPDRRIDGRESLAAVPTGLCRFRLTQHLLGQQVLLTLDSGMALAQLTCVAHHIVDMGAAAGRLSLHVRYLDTFAAADTGWLLEERQVRCDWVEWRGLAKASLGKRGNDDGDSGGS